MSADVIPIAPVDTERDGRTVAEVMAAVGITYRQLDHWCRAGYLPDNARGYGSRRTFTDSEVDVIHAASALIDAGLMVAAAFQIAHHVTSDGRYRTVIGDIYELEIRVRDTEGEAS